MRKACTLFSLMMVCVVGVCLSQEALGTPPPTLEWVYTLNMSLFAPREILVDLSGNVYLAGSVSVFDRSDFLIAKLDPDGHELWRVIYDYPGSLCPNAFSDDGVYDLHVDIAPIGGDVHVSGTDAYQPQCSNFSSRLFTAAYDKGGNFLWSQAEGDLSAGRSGRGGSVTQDIAGNVYVVGGFSRPFSYIEDILVIKYDANGNKLWSTLYVGDSDKSSAGSGIASDSFDNVIVVGTKGVGASENEMVTLKYDSSGNLLWSQQYSELLNINRRGSNGGELIIDEEGNIYVAGRVGNQKTALIKYDPNGNVIWRRTELFRQDYNCARDCLMRDSVGDIVLAGTPNNGRSDFGVVKYDVNGNRLWSTSYRSPTPYAGPGAGGLDIDSSNNIYLTGSYRDVLTYKFKCAAVKFDSNGTLVYDFTLASTTSECYPNAFQVEELSPASIHILTYATGWPYYTWEILKYQEQPTGNVQIGSNSINFLDGVAQVDATSNSVGNLTATRLDPGTPGCFTSGLTTSDAIVCIELSSSDLTNQNLSSTTVTLTMTPAELSTIDTESLVNDAKDPWYCCTHPGWFCDYDYEIKKDGSATACTGATETVSCIAGGDITLKRTCSLFSSIFAIIYITDADQDGILNKNDNCILDANPEQFDLDSDGRGDVCDTDDDGDGVADEFDQCAASVPDPITLNANQYAQTNLTEEGTNPFECGSRGDQSEVYTMESTHGCTCAQIISALGLGEGHLKKGCSPGVMQQFTGIAHKGDRPCL